MTDWQYRQTVRPYSICCALVRSAWTQQFDWAYWKASARTLPVNHPTIAREGATVNGAGQQDPTQTDGQRTPCRVRRDTCGMADKR